MRFLRKSSHLSRLAYRLDVLERRLANARQLHGWDRALGPETRKGANRPGGTSGEAHLPVIMTTWKRPDKLSRTIDLLAAQTHLDISLHIWNNNPSIAALIDSTVTNTDARFPITVTHSSRNAGSIGRFYLARDLASVHRYVVCVDDDQVFPPHTLAVLLDEVAPATAVAFWAFHFTKTTPQIEANSRRAAAPGERVDYVGPGGMICDSSLFAQPGFWKCPKRFWFCDDIWLSYFANSMGWELFKSSILMNMDNDGLDQYPLLYRTKTEMIRYFVQRDWNVGTAI